MATNQTRFDFESFGDLLKIRAEEIRTGMARPCGTDAFLMGKAAELIRRLKDTITDRDAELESTQLPPLMPVIHARLLVPSIDPNLLPTPLPTKEEFLPDEDEV